MKLVRGLRPRGRSVVSSCMGLSPWAACIAATIVSSAFRLVQGITPPVRRAIEKTNFQTSVSRWKQLPICCDFLAGL